MNKFETGPGPVNNEESSLENSEDLEREKGGAVESLEDDSETSRPDNFERVYEKLNEVLNDSDPMNRMMFENIPGDLKEMAKGGDPRGNRKEIYPGWSDEDFEELCERLNIN